MSLAIQKDKELSRETKLVLWFDECGIADVPLVGGKNASLGEMVGHLAPQGIRIPNGFATTAFAYRQFLAVTGIDQKLRALFAGLAFEDIGQVHDIGQRARSLILEASLPDDLAGSIRDGYLKLCEQYGPNTDVAVRSSATAEDLPDASFCWAARNISQRARSEGGFGGVQEMLCFDLYGSRDPLPAVTRFRPVFDRSFDRHSEDGSLGLGQLRRDFFDRYGNRLQRCSTDQRFLWIR